ncbi:hypothetical protein GCM10011297_32610 [Bacterioplanes sanyensis]|nr:hypothetical protein GCM10011297_32610 [Bacterioplanes sanyensis]
MGQATLPTYAAGIDLQDVYSYAQDETGQQQRLRLDPVITNDIVAEVDYWTYFGRYSRLSDLKDVLRNKLLDEFKHKSKAEKQDILRQLRNSGGINFAAELQDRDGEHNYYTYGLNIDLDASEADIVNGTDTLENYITSSVDEFHRRFREYVEFTEGEGNIYIDYLKLTAKVPLVYSLGTLNSSYAEALGIEAEQPASPAGQQQQAEVLNKILEEASQYGNDLTQSPTFLAAAYKLAEQAPGFYGLSEEGQAEAAAIAGNRISYWIEQQRIAVITNAQNKLKDNPITPDVLFLQELADAMGVSHRSLPALASVPEGEDSWEGKSAFQHFSNEGALYQFLDAFVPEREYWENSGTFAASSGFRANSKRKGFTKEQIINKLYAGLEVVDEDKKSEFLMNLNLAFDSHYGQPYNRTHQGDRHSLNYDILPEFMRDLPSYFVKKRAELASEARKHYEFLEAKKYSIIMGREEEFEHAYKTWMHSNSITEPHALPELEQLDLMPGIKGMVEQRGQRFYDHIIAASDKDDFKALSTNLERTLTSVAELVEFVPFVGSLISAPIHAHLGNWTSFGTSMASGLADVLSLGTSRMATSVGNAAKNAALKAGKTTYEAAEAGSKAAQAFLKSTKVRAIDISSVAFGTGAESLEFGLGVEALLNARTPEERRLAIMGLITTSVMVAPTPVIYTARKLNRPNRNTSPVVTTEDDGISSLPKQDVDTATDSTGPGLQGKGNEQADNQTSSSSDVDTTGPAPTVSNDYPVVIGNKFPAQSGRLAHTFDDDLPELVTTGAHSGLLQNTTGELFVAPDGPGGKYHQVVATEEANIYYLKSGSELQLRRKDDGTSFQLERKTRLLVKGGGGAFATGRVTINHVFLGDRALSAADKFNIYSWRALGAEVNIYTHRFKKGEKHTFESLGLAEGDANIIELDDILSSDKRIASEDAASPQAKLDYTRETLRTWLNKIPDDGKPSIDHIFNMVDMTKSYLGGTRRGLTVDLKVGPSAHLKDYLNAFDNRLVSYSRGGNTASGLPENQVIGTMAASNELRARYAENFNSKVKRDGLADVDPNEKYYDKLTSYHGNSYNQSNKDANRRRIPAENQWIDTAERTPDNKPKGDDDRYEVSEPSSKGYGPFRVFKHPADQSNKAGSIKTKPEDIQRLAQEALENEISQVEGVNDAFLKKAEQALRELNPAG